MEHVGGRSDHGGIANVDCLLCIEAPIRFWSDSGFDKGMIAGSVARPFIVDTDIGSDVDDAMVLSAVSRFSSLSLIGVTCVYGDVSLRAKIALKYLWGSGLGEVPVYCGESSPISGREVWHSGLEGTALGELSEFAGRDGGVDFLVRSAREFAGELEILAIGPLTNIARAMEADNGFEIGRAHV